MTEDNHDLFESYLDQEFGASFRTEGTEGVHNLEQLCEGIGYGEGQFVGRHYIANFLADNPGAVELLVEFIRDGVCDQYNTEWRESLNLEDYRNDDEDEDEMNEFTVEEDEMVFSA